VATQLPSSQAQGILAVHQWMLNRHQDMVSLAQEPIPEPSLGDVVWHPTRRQFLEALLRGDSQTCLTIAAPLTKTLPD